MIGKLKKGSSFGGCIRYVTGKDEAKIIVSDGVLLGTNAEITQSFELQRQLNPRIKKPVGHIALSFKPDYPKHTSIKELELKIEDGISMGYNHIFCVIDMDTKDEEPERSQYQKLKVKYAKPINKPKKGIYCEVEFFETHRCTELFFLYYFRYTSRPYENQEQLLNDLNKCVEYRKTTDFFIKTKGLHGFFERNGGSLEKAMSNANKSMEERFSSGRDYTFSELGRLMNKLKVLE